jgi:PAS domain-containing protein
VVVLAHDGRILDANRRALAFAGAAAHDVVGHLLWETPGWAARPSLASWLRSAIDKLTTSSEPDGAETTSHDDDGHTWHLALVALPFAETGVACFRTLRGRYQSAGGS